jgi:hypothetical protein
MGRGSLRQLFAFNNASLTKNAFPGCIRSAFYRMPLGRLDRPLHTEGLTRTRQGIQLAAGSSRQVRPDAAAVLAERK